MQRKERKTMDFSQTLISMRKAKGWSQEQLGDMVGVSRQTVSKWELGDTTPEMDKLVALADLFGVSLDELTGRASPQSGAVPAPQEVSDETIRRVVRESFHYEYRSKAHIGSLPLVHINFGRGLYTAKGIIALGNIAVGFLSMGLVGIGVISLATLAIGLFGFGALALGGLVFGGVAVGYFAFGGIAVGVYSIGGVALASDIALGGYANAKVAIGHSPHGTVTALTGQNGMTLVDMTADVLRDLIDTTLPNTAKFIRDLFVNIVS